MPRVITLIACLLIGGAGEASAETILLTFSGEITSVSDPTNGRITAGIVQGSRFMATLSYDSDAAPIQGTLIKEYPFHSWSLTVGTRTFMSPVPYVQGDNVTIAYHHPDGTDAFILYAVLDRSLYEGVFNISLGDDTQTAFTSDRLPTSLDLARFQRAGIGLGLKPVGEDPQAPGAGFDGTITAIDVTSVPEPGGIVLLASGGVALLTVACRRLVASRQPSA